MKIEQIYTGCLAHGAYYLESNGEAAIIDPLRDVEPYIAMAKERGATIKYIFETHFHADFVSGHVELSKKTGATIVYGPTKMETGFDCLKGADNQLFKLGNATIKLIHTPGHTMESSCFLLMDETGKETAIFTGDTVFINDVGRPDLAQHVIADLTQEKLASHLYDSIHTKILPLSDELIVYPGHGAGSACGKNLGKETFDTLGHQKKVNYALNPELSREEFMTELLSGLTTPPGYFPQNVLKNIRGYDGLDAIMEQGMKMIGVEEFEKLAQDKEVVLIDTRKAMDFSKGYIPGAINIGVEGSFAVWVGTLVPDLHQRILLVADEGKEQEVITRLARVGYDNPIGFLEGGMKAWEKAGKPMETVSSITADEFAGLLQSNPDLDVLDVRKKSEYDSEHILQAINAPLDYFEKQLEKIEQNKTYFVHCAGGYRSMVFISLLRKRGYDQFVDVQGGITAIKKTGRVSLTDYVCPTTML
ncbi:MAG: MBL fold metallo-hydrolase [Bacteroidia bacterium]|nr:MBL fold metallo-hydrolase [Bacteroidia bacterium]